ncbi:MAG TPA: PA14 domain-containing protein [Pirellulales bacterium]|nr:PA14 domain-containing protein [Pirellulales bacterium]
MNVLDTETDADTIANAADRQMAHVRTFQAGQHSANSQKLLNELSAARICLLNAEKKAAYDAELQRRLTPPADLQPVAPQPAEPQNSAVGPVAPWSAAPQAAPQPIRTPQPLPVQIAWPSASRPTMAAPVQVRVPSVLEPRVVIVKRGTKRRRASGWPMAIVAVVFGVVFVVGVIWTHPRPKERPVRAGVPNPPQHGEASRIDRVTASPVDLLKLIDPDRDAIRGTWQFKDGQLVMPDVAGARLEIRHQVPEEYTLTAVVECVSHKDALVIGLVVGDWPTMVVVDGWGTRVSGLSVVDGRLTDANVTKNLGHFLRDGPRNKIVCKVRKTQIHVTCNETVIVNWSGDVARLSLDPNWRIPNPRHLFVGAHFSPFRVSELSLVPLEPGGKATELADRRAQTAEPVVPPTPKRPAVPGSKALQVAEQKVTALFGDEERQSTTAEARLVFAHKLLDRARWEQDETAVRYALARKAQELAIGQGDAVTACRALEAIAGIYDAGDLLAERAKLVSQALAQTAPVTDEMAWANALLAMSVADGAAQAERYDLSKRLVGAAVAGKAKDRALDDKLLAFKNSLLERERRFDAYNQAVVKLRQAPADRDANLAAGRYELLVQGDWKSGPGRWAKLDDKALGELLRLDAEAYRKPDVQFSAARAWWNAASTAGAEWKRDYQLQAKYWCSRAVSATPGRPDATGAKPNSNDATWIDAVLAVPGYPRGRLRPGLATQLYNGIFFQELRGQRIDRHVDWAFGGDGAPDPRVNGDWYAVRWTGWFKPPIAGNWRIVMHTDNGVRLWVDGKIVLDHWTAEVQTRWADLALTDDLHSVRIEYSEFWGAAFAEWWWGFLEAGERGRQPVPSESLVYDPRSPFEYPTMAGPRIIGPRPKTQFLSELTEQNVFVVNEWFRKGQYMDLKPISVGGKPSPHGLLIHPHDGISSASWDLGNRAEEFTCEVGVADAARPYQRTAVVFEALGDGRLLWRSPPILKEQTAPCHLTAKDGIAKVRMLELRVVCPGDNAWAHAIWIEPRVTWKTKP